MTPGFWSTFLRPYSDGELLEFEIPGVDVITNYFTILSNQNKFKRKFN